jgi:hypothetical protein
MVVSLEKAGIVGSDSYVDISIVSLALRQHSRTCLSPAGRMAKNTFGRALPGFSLAVVTVIIGTQSDRNTRQSNEQHASKQPQPWHHPGDDVERPCEKLRLGGIGPANRHTLL